MKQRKKAIRRAERRGAREWSRKYVSTYAAVMADKDARLQEMEAEAERLRDVGCIACPSLSEAQMLAKGLESDVERLTAILAAEKEQLAAAGDELRDVRAELVAVAADRDRLQQAHDQAQQEVRELAVHLHAADAERDRLRHGERERLNVGTGMLRACNEKLEAQVVQLTAERNYYIDCLNTERGEWQRTITQEQASTRAGWARADELREQRESLRERVEELQAENARLLEDKRDVIKQREELSAERDRLMGDVGHLTEENARLQEHACFVEARLKESCSIETTPEVRDDARLGRLVRAMPGGLELYRTEEGTPWRTAYLGDREPRFGETPEAALEAAGVTIPPVANADSGLWRYAEERRAATLTDAARLDYLDALPQKHGWQGWQVLPDGLVMSNVGGTIRDAIDRAMKEAAD